VKLTSLPTFDVPVLPKSATTAEAYAAWLRAGYLDAVQNGTLEKRREDPLAVPVGSRFSLAHEKGELLTPP
jgi:hypothetical protein